MEQKNWSVVRQTVGYNRMQTDEDLAVLQSIYSDLRLYSNYFQPVLKLVGKRQVDGRTKRVYDEAKTPYRRVLELVELKTVDKVRLAAVYARLSPVKLRTAIDTKVDQLLKNVR